MKTAFLIILTISLFLVASPQLPAGALFYQAIPATESDANSGISNQNQYTSAIDGGNKRGTDRVINGITLYALVGNGQSSSSDNCTINSLTGSLSNAGGNSKSIKADGVLKDVLSDMTFNANAENGSQQEIVLAPDSLEQGATYDLRVYIANFSGQDRQVNLAFVGDDQEAVETGFFNEDDARTSPGGFTDPNQVYYINYRYTWDGETTPGITVTQKSGSAPFVLYALTNQVVPAGAAGPAGPAGAAPAVSTGLVSAQGADNVGVESDDFYNDDALSKYGRWIDIAKYGKCWVLTQCPPGWRPYVNGSWRFSDEDGWVFVSDEPWAWATYHYGRWIQVELNFGCGWAWVPGNVWSGGWVSWREAPAPTGGTGGGAIGWAPLPPEVPVMVDTGMVEPGMVDVGIDPGVDATFGIGPDFFTFVNIVDFGVSSFLEANVIFNTDQVLNIFDNSVNITNVNVNVTNVTNITQINNNITNVYNGGPSFAALDKTLKDNGKKGLDKVHVDHQADGKLGKGKNSELKGNNLAIHSPNVKKDGQAKNKPKTTEHLTADKTDKGWKNVKDPATKNKIKDHIANENKGKGGAATAGQKGGQHPGKQGKVAGTGKTLGGGKATGAGADQHPGKPGKNAGAKTLGGAAAAGGAAGFDQHPGKKGKTTAGAGQLGGAGAGQHPGKQGKTTAGAGQLGGTGSGQHPGKQGKTAAGAGQLGGAGIGQHPGKKGGTAGAQSLGATTGGGTGLGQHPGKQGKVTGAGGAAGAGAQGTTAGTHHPGKAGTMGGETFAGETQGAGAGGGHGKNAGMTGQRGGLKTHPGGAQGTAGAVSGKGKTHGKQPGSLTGAAGGSAGGVTKTGTHATGKTGRGKQQGTTLQKGGMAGAGAGGASKTGTHATGKTGRGKQQGTTLQKGGMAGAGAGHVSSAGAKGPRTQQTKQATGPKAGAAGGQRKQQQVQKPKQTPQPQTGKKRKPGT